MSHIACRSPGQRTSLAVDLFSDHSTPAVTLTDGRASGAQPTWDVAASFSRTKAYLVQAEDSLYSASKSLSATCILDIVPPTPGEHSFSCRSCMYTAPGISCSMQANKVQCSY